MKQTTYDGVVLLHPDLEIDVEAPIAKIENLIKESGGKVTKKDNWGKKRLAYRIKKQDFAIYVYFEVELDGEKVRELERQILITEEIIRHIIVVHEANPEAAVQVEKDDNTSNDDKKEVEDGKEL